MTTRSALRLVLLVAVVVAGCLVGWRLGREGPTKAAAAATEPRKPVSEDCPVPMYPVWREYQQPDGSWALTPVEGAVQRLHYPLGDFNYWVPKGWDALSATPDQRSPVGIPELPTDPAGLPRWLLIVAAQVGTSTRECQFPNISNGEL